MAKALVVGCGDLGGEVAKLLADSGHEIIGVRVSNKPLAHNLSCIQADVTQANTLTILESVKPNVIVYCVAANMKTDESYRVHYVDGLRNVLATQKANSSLKHVFFISSTRVYGQLSDELLDEAIEPMPSDFGGERLLEAECLLERLPCNATSIRLSGIYGPDRLYLVDLAKDPSRWPAVNKWTNRIHRDDAARFVAFLCEKVIVGQVVENCYIGVDDMPALQYDVLAWLATKLGVTVAPSMSASLEVGGKRLGNRRMRASGFKLKYASYQHGYEEILKNEMLKND